MRVCFTHLGCKLNQAEIEALARSFAAAGHEVVASPASADLHVVNSCTVTTAAARTSRKAARRFPGVRTVLTGCYATASPEEAARLAGVDLVVPNSDKERLLERVHAAFPEGVPEVPAMSDEGVDMDFGPTRALVKVEDGCNMRCAFCIIPATRGRQRSRTVAEVVSEVRGLVAAGYREVVLTGVQISAFRDGEARLVELVRAVLAETAVERLRLTSIAPWEVDPRLLELWADRRLCRHLHLSLQSGADATLRRMRRPYSAAGYGRLLKRLRAAVPGVAVTTDVIVGFPGETAAEFEESLAAVASFGFAKVHVFPFSARPGTEAAGLPDQVGSEGIKERMGRMLAVASKAERAFRAAHLGQREMVLWERPRGGVAQGLTDTYLRVLARTERDLWNRFAVAEVREVAEDGVWGEVMEEEVHPPTPPGRLAPEALQRTALRVLL
jgi:threonylcarbamoyladenosine tRNA methylthiotransferase MtaB